MMKCPKCFFEQPPDTYCAKCGVNMETYKPAPTPWLRMILTNWMVHLAVLITLIVSLVIYDRNKKPQPRSRELIASQVAYRKSTPTEDPAPEVSSSESTTATVAAKETRPAPFRKSLNPEDSNGDPHPEPSTTKEAAPTKIQSNGTVATTAIQGLNISFYHASRTAIAELQKEARSLHISGDGMGGVLWKKQFSNIEASGELKSVGKNSYKDFQVNQSIVIFKGQRSSMTGKNIGLNFQITPLKKESTTGILEVKGWSNIREPGTDDPMFTSEMTLNSQYLSFVTGFLPKDRPLNDEEKSLFESDRTLKIYNNPGFWDDAIDLIMVVEFTTKP